MIGCGKISRSAGRRFRSSAGVISIQHDSVPAQTLFLSEVLSSDWSVPGLANSSSGFLNLNGSIHQTLSIEESIVQTVEVPTPLFHPPRVVTALINLLNPATRVHVIEESHSAGVIFPLGVGPPSIQSLADCLLLLCQFHHNSFSSLVISSFTKILQPKLGPYAGCAGYAGCNLPSV